MSLNTTRTPSENSATSVAFPSPGGSVGPGKPARDRESRNRSGGGGRGTYRKGPQERPPQEVLKTWAFDSVGNRKYALQIRKASNGNPCIKIVEGVPQPDGTFRKFDLTIWSEDWPRLFETLNALRAFVVEQNIKTPDGHKYDPGKKPWQKRKTGAKGPH